MKYKNGLLLLLGAAAPLLLHAVPIITTDDTEEGVASHGEVMSNNVVHIADDDMVDTGVTAVFEPQEEKVAAEPGISTTCASAPDGDGVAAKEVEGAASASNGGFAADGDIGIMEAYLQAVRDPTRDVNVPEVPPSSGMGELSEHHVDGEEHLTRASAPEGDGATAVETKPTSASSSEISDNLDIGGITDGDDLTALGQEMLHVDPPTVRSSSGPGKPAEDVLDKTTRPAATDGHGSGSDTSSRTPARWESVGCFSMGDDREAFEEEIPPSSGMTTEACFSMCTAMNFEYLMIANGDLCLCLEKKFVEVITHRRSRGICRTPCDGDSSQHCGGDGAFELFVARSSSAARDQSSEIDESTLGGRATPTGEQVPPSPAPAAAQAPGLEEFELHLEFEAKLTLRRSERVGPLPVFFRLWHIADESPTASVTGRISPYPTQFFTLEPGTSVEEVGDVGFVIHTKEGPWTFEAFDANERDGCVAAVRAILGADSTTSGTHHHQGGFGEFREASFGEVHVLEGFWKKRWEPYELSIIDGSYLKICPGNIGRVMPPCKELGLDGRMLG
eukprot:g9627.t1